MHSDSLVIGSATARPGELVNGELPVLDLPSGGRETLPVSIAQGREEGPTLWLTANIHGAEVTGIAVIHRIMTDELARQLRGTIVAIPTLNPAGLRTGERAPYYGRSDPNRLWPERATTPASETLSSNPYEQVVGVLFDLLTDRCDLAIDLHNAAIRSLPFTIVDRMLFQKEADRQRATALGARLTAFAQAFGLSTVREAAAEKYLRQTLHRSLSGALVNVLGLPALTVELGMTGAIDPAALEAGVQGVHNVLRWAGMLPGTPAPITACPVIDPGFATKRDTGAKAPVAGILVPLIEPGARFTAGEPIARMNDIWGRPLPYSDITLPADGWLIGWANGLAKYAGQTVASIALRDDEPLVAPMP